MSSVSPHKSRRYCLEISGSIPLNVMQDVHEHLRVLAGVDLGGISEGFDAVEFLHLVEEDTRLCCVDFQESNGRDADDDIICQLINRGLTSFSLHAAATGISDRSQVAHVDGIGNFDWWTTEFYRGKVAIDVTKLATLKTGTRQLEDLIRKAVPAREPFAITAMKPIGRSVSGGANLMSKAVPPIKSVPEKRKAPRPAVPAMYDEEDEEDEEEEDNIDFA